MGTAVNGFAPAASVSSSTRLNGTGGGGQAEEDDAMYYAPPKVGKKVATVDNTLKQKQVAPGSKSAPAWQLSMMGSSAPKKAEAAPKSKKVEEKKSKFPWL